MRPAERGDRLGSIDVKRNLKNCTAVLFAGAFLSVQAYGTDARAESRAHQHGVGHLNIAVEGHHVEVELVVPGADVVGFEHAPSTTADKRAVREASHRLEDGKKIIAFPPAARCDFEKAEVRSTLLGGHDKHDDHAHGGHGHHKDGHDKKGHAAQEVHGEFRVHYHVECARMANLTHLDVTFFKAFPAAGKLVTRWIGASGQGGATLTASNPRLTFQAR